MAEALGAVNSILLSLYPVRWSQIIQTNRAAAMHMQIEAEASKRTAARLSVPGLGNILELPFELPILRGPTEWTSAALPHDAMGFLTCQENQPDEFGMHRAVVGGGISLPEKVFDDAWQRVRLSPDLASKVSIRVGPVNAHGTDEFVWDRAKGKMLVISDVSLTFTRSDGRPFPDRQ